VQVQTDANVLAAINPEVLQYLIHTMNQYGQIPMNNPEQMQPQMDPPKTQHAETEGGLKGCAPKPLYWQMHQST
jgi:hypothetical protein